jgi:O-antigen/teichoic acid export membrane protein
MTRRDPDSPTRNVFFAGLSQAVGALFTALITLALVRLLDPDGYGVYALALGMGVVMLPFLDLGVSISATRFAAEHRDDPSAVWTVLASAVRLKLAISAAGGIALFMLAGPIADGYDVPELRWAIRVMALSVIAQSFFLLLAGIYQAMGRVSFYLRTVGVESSLEAFAAIGLVLAGAGALGAVWGRAAGYIVAVAVGFALLGRVLGRRRGRQAGETSAVTAPGWQRIAGYAVPLVAVEVLSVAFGQLGVLMVGGYLGVTAAGLFEAPLKLSIFMQQAGLALAAGFTPRLARLRDRELEAPRFERALRFSVVLYGATIAPLVVWAGPIVDLALGGGYERSEEVLRALAAFTFLAGPGILVSIGANYLGEAARRVPIALAALGVSAALNVILIPELGIVAGAISSGVGYLIYVPAQYLLCRRLLDLHTARLLATTARALVAAAAMSAVLLAIGDDALSVWQWLAGGLLGPLAYLGSLLLTREVSTLELRQVWAAVRSRLPR